MTKSPCVSYPAVTGLGHSFRCPQLKNKVQTEWFISLIEWAKSVHPFRYNQPAVTNKLLNYSSLASWDSGIQIKIVFSTHCLKKHPGNYTSGIALWTPTPWSCKLSVEAVSLLMNSQNPDLWVGLVGAIIMLSKYSMPWTVYPGKLSEFLTSIKKKKSE